MEEVAGNPYYWNPDDHDLDEPMIHPASIPEGYKQHWSEERRRFVLVRAKIWNCKNCGELRCGCKSGIE